MKRIIALLVVVVSFAAVPARAADSTTVSRSFLTPDALLKIHNPDSVKGFYGSHVTITAKADADSKTVHIDSVAEAK